MTNTALDSFLEKWRARWPEWQVAESFVPAHQRELAAAWFSLLQEFEDAMNVEGETLPADAKLAWWGEELRDWARQRSRHPLGRVLQPNAAPWFELGEALPTLQRLREVGDAQTAQPLAQAIAAIEATLFAADAAENSVPTIAAHLLSTRARVEWPQRIAGSVPRRIYSGIARARKPDAAVPLPKVVWLAWKAAR